MNRDSGVVSPLSWSVYREDVASCLLAGAKNLRVTRREGIVQQARDHFALPPGHRAISISVPQFRRRELVEVARVLNTLNSQHSASSNRRGRPCVRSIRRRTHPSHKRRACRSLSSPRHCRKQASSTKSKLRGCWLRDRDYLSQLSVIAAVSCGERASLSALLDEGKRAVTVRVDEARGVAGLAHPGESPYGASFCQRVLQHSNSFAS